MTQALVGLTGHFYYPMVFSKIAIARNKDTGKLVIIPNDLGKSISDLIPPACEIGIIVENGLRETNSAYPYCNHAVSVNGKVMSRGYMFQDGDEIELFEGNKIRVENLKKS